MILVILFTFFIYSTIGEIIFADVIVYIFSH